MKSNKQSLKKLIFQTVITCVVLSLFSSVYASPTTKMMLKDTKKAAMVIGFNTDTTFSREGSFGGGQKKKIEAARKSARALTTEEVATLNAYMTWFGDAFEAHYPNVQFLEASTLQSMIKSSPQTGYVYKGAAAISIPYKKRFFLTRMLEMVLTLNVKANSHKIDKKKIQKWCNDLGVDVIYFVDLGFNINNGNLALVGGAWTVIDYEISIYGFHKNGNVLMFEGSVESPPFKEHLFIPKPYQDAPYANAYTALAKIGANGIKTNFRPQDQ